MADEPDKPIGSKICVTLFRLAVLKLKLLEISARLRGRELSPYERQDIKAELDKIEREQLHSQMTSERRESCLKGVPADVILAPEQRFERGGPVEWEPGMKNCSYGQFESKRSRH
jgi:hypothetical protein